MSAFGNYTLIIIFYQLVFSLIISWWTLGCRSAPDVSELQELTLVKLLYLYEPESCGVLRFYNLTLSTVNEPAFSTIIWPEKNMIAASFREKLKLHLTLHIMWFSFGVVSVLYGARSCGFYFVLVPFTAVGVTILIVDCVFAASFLRDVHYTKTELGIVTYVVVGEYTSLSTLVKDAREQLDTSWIALLLAYLSVRGVLQWMINFWLVQDNFLRGLAVYRLNQKQEQLELERTRSF